MESYLGDDSGVEGDVEENGNVDSDSWVLNIVIFWVFVDDIDEEDGYWSIEYYL